MNMNEEKRKKKEERTKREEEGGGGRGGGYEIEGIGRKRSGEGGVDVKRGGEKEEGGREDH